MTTMSNEPIPIERARERARRLALALVSDRDVAEDIAQDAALRIVQGRLQASESYRGLLATTVRRLVINRWRSKHRRRHHETSAVDGRRSIAATDDLAAMAEMQATLWTLVRELPEPYGSTLLLRFLEGLPPRRIAKNRSVPVETVKSQLKRGLRMLRVRMDRQYGGRRELWMTGLLPLLRHPPTGVLLGTRSLMRTGGAVMKKSTMARLAILLPLLLATGGVVLWATGAFEGEDETSSPKHQAKAVDADRGNREIFTDEGGLARTSNPTLRASPIAPNEIQPASPTSDPLETKEDKALADTESEQAYTIEGIATLRGSADVVTQGVVVAVANVISPNARTGEFRRTQKTWRSEIDSKGHFCIRVSGSPLPRVSRLTYEGRDHHLVSWKLDKPGTPQREQLGPIWNSAMVITHEAGHINRVKLNLAPSFRLRGFVTDEDGVRLGGAKIQFGVPHGTPRRRAVFGQREVTGVEGRFDIGPFLASGEGNVIAGVTITKDGYATAKLDPWSLERHERDNVRVVMSRGATLEGHVLSPSNEPLQGVVVEVEFGDYQRRVATRTDASGRFRLERVSYGRATLRARAFQYGAIYEAERDIEQDELELDLKTEPVFIAPEDKQIVVLGLTLVDVDERIRKAYRLPKQVTVAIVACDETHKRLGVGTLEPGYGLWMVGDTAVSNTKDLIERILRHYQKLNSRSSSGEVARDPGLRTVYTFANERMSGSSTQHLRLSADHQQEVENLARRMGIESE